MRLLRVQTLLSESFRCYFLFFTHAIIANFLPIELTFLILVHSLLTDLDAGRQFQARTTRASILSLPGLTLTLRAHVFQPHREQFWTFCDLRVCRQGAELLLSHLPAVCK